MSATWKGKFPPSSGIEAATDRIRDCSRDFIQIFAGLNKTKNKRGVLWGAGLLLTLLGFWLFLKLEAFPGHQELKSFLMSRLAKIEPAGETLSGASSDSDGVIYVLGGAPQSLENRFKTASDLYKKGMAQKILIDAGRMRMGYSPKLKRNLTFNEWAVRRLTSLGVREKDTEPISIQKGFFGTFSEARSVSDLVLKRNYKTLILVSSKYHTRRVWESFSKFVGDKNLHLYVYAASDSATMRSLLLEYFKLQVYRALLI